MKYALYGVTDVATCESLKIYGTNLMYMALSVSGTGYYPQDGFTGVYRPNYSFMLHVKLKT
jgi:hypothetical protein